MRAEVWKVVEKRGSNPRGATSIAITSVPGSPPRRQPVRGTINSRMTESRRQKQKADGRRRKAESRKQKAEGRSRLQSDFPFSIFHFPFVICHLSFVICHLSFGTGLSAS